MLSNETKSTKRHSDTPSDKPVADRVEHGNHERPGAQVHPRAHIGWGHPDAVTAWKMRA